MARKKFEFYCTECKKYFDFTLRDNLNGNYRIHCPNPKCKHVHYRQLKDGTITEGRFDVNDKNVLIDDICPMPSSCRDVQKETPEKVAPTRQGFFARLWERTAQPV